MKAHEHTAISTALHPPKGENLRHILRSHKIRSTFYTENTLRKLLCKPRYRVATEDKNKVVYEIDYSTCQAVSFGVSKQ